MTRRIKNRAGHPGESVVVGSLNKALIMMVLATLVASLLCGVVAGVCGGIVDVWMAIAAAAISLPVGAIVVLYLCQRGLGVELIVGATLLRLGLTALLASSLLVAVPESRSPAFLLSLAVIYVANLGVETWCVLGRERQSQSCR